MSAMTMPFRVQEAAELGGLRKGDAISFRLTVGTDESWIDRIVKTARTNLPETGSVVQVGREPGAAKHRHPLMDFKFTNELGQAVSLSEFHGQALAITFFFTRCPIPDFCPRLSKNFAEASQKLGATPNAPTNWHFLSVTFDPKFDTPAVLKAYGERYHYDPKRWSFLTGPVDKIAELARESDVNFQPEGGLINHNFRTLIIGANGKLQTVFPVSGSLSDAITSEMLKAAAPTSPAGIAERRVEPPSGPLDEYR